MQLYFNNAVNSLPDTLGNYWQDYGATTPAAALPDWSADTVDVLATANMLLQTGHGVTIGNGGALQILSGATLQINGGETLTVESGGTLTIDSGATFTGPGTVTVASGSSVTIFGVPVAGSESGDAPDPDDLRDGVTVNGVTGNLIVPAAEDLVDGAHAGWHHTGTPDTWEVTGTAVVILTSDADKGTGTLVCYSNAGVVAAGISITVQLKAAPDDDSGGHGYSTVPRTLVTGANGVVQFSNLFRNTDYVIWEGGGTPVEFTTPDEASFELPTVLGDDSPYNAQQLGAV